MKYSSSRVKDRLTSQFVRWSGKASDVLEFLLRHHGLPTSQAVGRWLARVPLDPVDPRDRRLYRYPVELAVRYLMNRNLDRELATERFEAFAAFAEADGAEHGHDLGRYSQIALDWFPERALRLVRTALRWYHKAVVVDVAAALVALDLSWCVRELEAAYREQPPHADSLREALGLFSDRPADILPVIGQSRVAIEAAWYRGQNACRTRQYPPHFGDDGSDGPSVG